MTEAQENELAGMITDVAISYANGHATDFRIAAKAAVAFVTDAQLADPAIEWEMEWPQYSHSGMGCGLEDRGIVDPYDAMRYGWDEAMEQVACVLVNQTLYATPRISESDAAYWIANRAAIIDAISKAGFKLMSNKNGFWLLNVQDDEPKTNGEPQ